MDENNIYPYRIRETYKGVKIDIKAKTQKKLAENYAKKKKEIDEGKKTSSKNITVTTWFDKYMEEYKGDISPETRDDYYSRYNSKIKPVIGAMKVSDVKEIHCQRVINSMKGNSLDYIRKVNNLMFDMFKRAKKNHYADDNPADDLKIPIDAVDGERREITETERYYTYKVAEYHRAGLWVKTIMLAGLRPGETAALQGRHLDFKNNWIIIEAAVKRKDRRIGDPKTGAGKRRVPMPPELIDEYKALNVGPFEFVFKNTLGGQLSSRNMRTMWDSFKSEMNIAMGCKVYRNKILPLNWEAVQRNGMEPIYPVAADLVPYCYRHTYSTDMREAGCSLDDMAGVMGHEDTDTTQGYTHESKEALKRVQKKMAQYQEKTRKQVKNFSHEISHQDSTEQAK